MATFQVPSRLQFEEILSWLKREQEEDYDGFYCKKDMLVEAFYDSQMHCVLSEGKAVGFDIYSLLSTGASIDIFEIHPLHRRKRLGTQLARATIEHLFELGVAQVAVNCTPASSATFWRALGFTERANVPHMVGEAVRLIMSRQSYSFNATVTCRGGNPAPSGAR